VIGDEAREWAGSRRQVEISRELVLAAAEGYLLRHNSLAGKLAVARPVLGQGDLGALEQPLEALDEAAHLPAHVLEGGTCRTRRKIRGVHLGRRERAFPGHIRAVTLGPDSDGADRQANVTTHRACGTARGEHRLLPARLAVVIGTLDYHRIPQPG